MRPAQRLLPIDLDDLKLAWSGGFEETAHYLDRETGEVVSITGETQRLLEALLARMEDAPTERVLEGVLAAIQEQPWPQWQRQAVGAAAVVELVDGDRFLSIPQADSQEAYDDRVAFVQTVRNTQIHAKLQDALQGKGAFGRFKAVLGRYSDERERWYRFEEERIHERLLEWLDAEGITPVAPGSSVREDR
jgi:uncharacterized protein UPF0158